MRFKSRLKSGSRQPLPKHRVDRRRRERHRALARLPRRSTRSRRWMSHGHTRIASRGACIYCGAHDVVLTDEHVIPLSLGGQHILEGASCQSCADVTTRFERDVARDMWGDARNSYNVQSRRKRERKTHMVLPDPADSSRRVKIPYAEYPAPMVFYKMGPAGLLEGMPDTVDMSHRWQLVA